MLFIAVLGRCHSRAACKKLGQSGQECCPVPWGEAGVPGTGWQSRQPMLTLGPWGLPSTPCTSGVSLKIPETTRETVSGSTMATEQGQG